MSFNNPAALAALASGDIANALRAATPGGIEKQEAAGQKTFCASQMLPKEISNVTREQLAAIGFIFGKDVDDLFVECLLPPGWTKRATEHSMHSNLLDELGRERAGIFYKAAFYDRSASMSMSCRYSYHAYGDSPTAPNFSPVVATDCGKPIKTFGEYERAGKGYKIGDALQLEAQTWLDQTYPDWRNPLAYW